MTACSGSFRLRRHILLLCVLSHVRCFCQPLNEITTSAPMPKTKKAAKRTTVTDVQIKLPKRAKQGATHETYHTFTLVWISQLLFVALCCSVLSSDLRMGFATMQQSSIVSSSHHTIASHVLSKTCRLVHETEHSSSQCQKTARR